MEARLEWLTDPTVFQVNRLEAHSDHVCYADGKEAEEGKSSLRQSLDGIWRFRWSQRPADRPADFWREGYDDGDFGVIQVPGHMELQGYGQVQYINSLYPWDGHAFLRPPQIDWDNDPVGSYVREFDLEPGLRGKRVCVSFQGVEQGFYLWLNGHFVGYGEDSFTPSDFDLTPYVRERGNRLCVEVYKHTSAAWLEDQDFFRFSGIFRSVFLYAKPEVHLEDVWFQTDLERPSSAGTLRLRLKLSGEVEGANLRLRVDDPAGETRLAEELELEEAGEYLWSREFRLEDVLPWSHERPDLYRAVLELRGGDGAVAEVIPYPIGFRRLEVVDGVIRLNGEKLWLNGVNRHEWNPERGRAVTREDMEQAMAVFRRSGINAVRTCHYPNQTLWYELCDQNGIYMMDEANLESHGSWQKLGRTEPSWNVPGDRPEWRECVLDRAKSMFERDKNHPSILFWSCGNESYAGEDILAMAEFFRASDPGRIVHYEGVYHNRAYDAISDVESRMYATPREAREYLEQGSGKPYLLCEYMHNMGNSLGGMEKYVQLGEEFPRYHGGFVWDYMDQALWKADRFGRRVLGYGGDFGDRQSDYAFSANGLVGADGTEKPAMQELRYWYLPREKREKRDRHNAFLAENCGFPRKRGEYGPIQVTLGEGAIGVRGEKFELLFSYPEGGPCSLVCGGKEWLWRAPRPAFWRAPTENDLGNGFAARSAIWAAVEQGQRCERMELLTKNEGRAEILCVYTAPAMPGLRTELFYAVDGGGVTVTARCAGAAGRPQPALFGLRFATPEPVEQVEWLGLSGETYPDRKRGGQFGVHRETPGLPPYLVPQEYGGHADTRAVRLRGVEGETLRWEMEEEPFFFSAVPYTPGQLAEAYHREELPPPCRTVVTIASAMRGVGGIDSWGADVEEEFQLSGEEDRILRFRLDLA